MKKYVFAILLVGVIGAVFPAYARDLTSAANTWVNTLKSIAQALSIAGILAGAIIFQLPGMYRVGIGTLVSGVFGLILTFAAPGLIALANQVLVVDEVHAAKPTERAPRLSWSLF